MVLMVAALLGASICLLPEPVQTQAGQVPFRIHVVDKETGRGVPLVELRTTAEVRYYTDSAGNVAIDDPALQNQSVFFTVTSHGYTYPADSFGYTGLKLTVTPGAAADIKLTRRENRAERLYRITGEGIYRDTVLLGLKPPVANPLLNSQVTGQDSVMATPYRGKIWWFYGDTARPSYPLGNFHTTGAWSLLPTSGGLDPETGVNLNYIAGQDGFVKGMFTTSKPGPIWIGGLCTVPDNSGAERLICCYSRMKDLGHPAERGIAIFEDAIQEFKPAAAADLGNPAAPQGHPVIARWHNANYVYSANADMTPVPLVRFPANLSKILAQRSREAYTPLASGTRFQGADTKLDRNPDGSLHYAWKPDTDELDFKNQQLLEKLKVIKPGEGLFLLRVVDTGKPTSPATGSVYWNAYRNRWVMIVPEIGGTSLLGEVWYSEADTITGPWVYARKIISHNNYSFYNPTQHPFLDKDGGRRIFIEGTYTKTFTQNQDPTPRYEYNQMMYGLTLSDPSLVLPQPVYQVDADYLCRERLTAAQKRQPQSLRVPFFALPPGRKLPNCLAAHIDARTGHIRLSDNAQEASFWVLPPATKLDGSHCAIFAFTNRNTGQVTYAETAPEHGNWDRAAEPAFVAWRNPCLQIAMDWETTPSPGGSH